MFSYVLFIFSWSIVFNIFRWNAKLKGDNDQEKQEHKCWRGLLEGNNSGNIIISTTLDYYWGI